VVVVLVRAVAAKERCYETYNGKLEKILKSK
jgi:hypothetical protein